MALGLEELWSKSLKNFGKKPEKAGYNMRLAGEQQVALGLGIRNLKKKKP